MFIPPDRYTSKILQDVRTKYPKASRISEAKVYRIITIFQHCLYKALIHQRKLKESKKTQTQAGKKKIGNILLFANPINQAKNGVNHNSGLIIKLKKKITTTKITLTY